MTLTPVKWLAFLSDTFLKVRCRSRMGDVTFSQGVHQVGQIIEGVKTRNARVWWVGNGGSAAVCSHLAQDMLNKLGIRSVFCGDIAMMTCMANDFGYENGYGKPLDVLMEKGDLLIAISSSGNSENILSCARLADKKEVDLISLSGFRPDNHLWAMRSSVSFYVPADIYGIVEIAHEAILHSIIESYPVSP